MTPAREPPVTHLLYLHGFRSSPRSTKAQQMAAWVARHRPEVRFCCPPLPPSPAEAMALITRLCADWPADRRAVVGSSLGGYYAALLVEALDCRGVLINPAVDPARDLARHIGTTTQWHSDDAFHFRAEFIGELQAMTPATLHRNHRLLVLIAQGDEVLDWREMVARHAGAQQRVLEGGDHALSDFPDHLPAIAQHLGW